MSKFYHFLGSISFAIFLIAAVATLAIAGTVIEARTESHRYAAYFTYDNPFFKALLWGFFVNILISALRRWPFQKKHSAFLVTHLGLLMILGGALVKGSWGTQGNMQILEGGASNQILIPESYAVKVTGHGGTEQYPLNKDLHLKKGTQGTFPDLDVQLVGYAPHGQVYYESWIRAGKVFIQGLKPLELHAETTGDFPISARLRLQKAPSAVWNLFAFKTDDGSKLTQKLLAQPQLLPALLITEEDAQVTLRLLETSGRVQTLHYPLGTPQTLAVYDQGFGGYCAFARFEIEGEEIVLESPLHCRTIPQKSLAKWEDNIPLITLRLKEGEQTTFVTLPYDATASQLKWPTLQGKYMLSFQPLEKTLPYKVRLRQARQINYPLSNQPFSYESDVLIHDLHKETAVERTISMNNVHETWDGYRFYLANMLPPDPGAVKRIHLVVNHDPTKYLLTYPGAAFLSLGIFLLFWLKPYARKGPDQ